MPATIHSAKCIAPYLYVRAELVENRNPLTGALDRYTVEFHWTWTAGDLDRPMTHSISTGRDRRLAERLCLATAVGAVHRAAVVKTDVYGDTYVEAACRVMGKYLNADLAALGY